MKKNLEIPDSVYNSMKIPDKDKKMLFYKN